MAGGLSNGRGAQCPVTSTVSCFGRGLFRLHPIGHPRLFFCRHGTSGLPRPFRSQPFRCGKRSAETGPPSDALSRRLATSLATSALSGVWVSASAKSRGFFLLHLPGRRATNAPASRMRPPAACASVRCSPSANQAIKAAATASTYAIGPGNRGPQSLDCGPSSEFTNDGTHRDYPECQDPSGDGEFSDLYGVPERVQRHGPAPTCCECWLPQHLPRLDSSERRLPCSST